MARALRWAFAATALLGVVGLRAGWAGVLVLIPAPWKHDWTMECVRAGKVVKSQPVPMPVVMGLDRSKPIVYLGSDSEKGAVVSGYRIDTGEQVERVTVEGATIPYYMQMPAPDLAVMKTRVVVPLMPVRPVVPLVWELGVFTPADGKLVRVPMPEKMGADVLFPLEDGIVGDTSISSDRIVVFSVVSGKVLTTIPKANPHGIPFYVGDRVYCWGDEEVRLTAVRTGETYEAAPNGPHLDFGGRISEVSPVVVEGKPQAVVMEMNGGTGIVAKVAVCDLLTMKVASEVSMPFEARNVLVSEDLKRAWGVDEADGDLKEIDMASGKVKTVVGTHYAKEMRGRVVLAGETRE